MINITPHERSIILQILHSTISECTVLAFGSRISGKHRRYSDLDLAIDGQKRFSVLQLFEVKEKFSDSELPFRVDILDWNALTPAFQDIISSSNVKIQ